MYVLQLSQSFLEFYAPVMGLMGSGTSRMEHLADEDEYVLIVTSLYRSS